AQTCWATWLQPILCLSVFQWHARKISSQPEKDATKEQYIMSYVASMEDSVSHGSETYSRDGSGRRHIGPPGPGQSCVSKGCNGMRGS
uniref:FZD3 n=1 Tax=Mesocestoides corti TaxID=53468 RepID=A0A5K3G6S9_MESCO